MHHWRSTFTSVALSTVRQTDSLQWPFLAESVANSLARRETGKIAAARVEKNAQCPEQSVFRAATFVSEIGDYDRDRGIVKGARETPLTVKRRRYERRVGDRDNDSSSLSALISYETSPAWPR